MPFETKGVLGEQVNEIIKENYKLYKDIFELSEEVNMYSQEITYLLNIKSNDTQGIVSTVLFIKILNTFQSIIILYKIGLESQCKALTRSALESLFVLKCITKDVKYLELLVNSEKKSRERLLTNIKKNPCGVFNDLINQIDIDELIELARNNHKNNIDIIQPKQWSEMSNSHYYYYYYVYSHLCKDVHIDLGNMEQ